MSAVERDQRVTALELFFDLVFVFAITQMTGSFKRRNIGSFNYPRLLAAAALLALVPAATRLPALLALALVAAVACGLIAYEVRRYAEARDRIRHAS